MTISACGPRCSALLLRAGLVIGGCLLYVAFAFAQTAAVRDAGYLTPSLPAFAPGQVVTLTLYGLKGPLPVSVAASTVPLPYTLAGISMTARQAAASPNPIPVPLFSLERLGDHTAAITIQVPFELVPSQYVYPGPGFLAESPSPGLPSDPSMVTEFVVSDNGEAGETIPVAVLTDRVHVATYCDTSVPLASRQPVISICTPVVTHADGSLVSSSSPAHPGETVVIYAHGFGRTQPAVPSGRASPVPAATALAAGFQTVWLVGNGPMSIGVGNLPPAGVPAFAGLTPGLVGLYQVNLTIPPISGEIRSCSTAGNLLVMIGGRTSFDNAFICVQP